MLFSTPLGGGWRSGLGFGALFFVSWAASAYGPFRTRVSFDAPESDGRFYIFVTLTRGGAAMSNGHGKPKPETKPKGDGKGTGPKQDQK